jgi:hypothetical protein
MYHCGCGLAGLPTVHASPTGSSSRASATQTILSWSYNRASVEAAPAPARCIAPPERSGNFRPYRAEHAI